MDGHLLTYPFLLMTALAFGTAISVLLAYKLMKLFKHLHKGAVMLMALIPLVSYVPLSLQATKNLDKSGQQQVKSSHADDEHLV